jgi:hypothetical protein
VIKKKNVPVSSHAALTRRFCASYPTETENEKRNPYNSSERVVLGYGVDKCNVNCAELGGRVQIPLEQGHLMRLLLATQNVRIAEMRLTSDSERLLQNNPELASYLRDEEMVLGIS